MQPDWLSEYENKRLETGKRKSDIPVLKTSYIEVDDALGVHGLPLGKVIDIAGPAGVGKTAFVLDIVASAQDNNLACVYLDLDRGFDSQFAHNRKVNIDDLLIFRPKTIEGIVPACEALMKEGLADLIIFDSVSSIDPSAISLKQVINPLLRKLLEYKSSLVFLSQIREDLANGGQVTPMMNEINDLSNIRMMLKKVESIKHLDVLIGKKVEVNIYKNDLATPAKAQIELYI